MNAEKNVGSGGLCFSCQASNLFRFISWFRAAGLRHSGAFKIGGLYRMSLHRSNASRHLVPNSYKLAEHPQGHTTLATVQHTLGGLSNEVRKKYGLPTNAEIHAKAKKLNNAHLAALGVKGGAKKRSTRRKSSKSHKSRSRRR